jgi:Fe-S cluster assembly iron-binding protein IscA
MTQSAIEVIKHLAPGESGLRVYSSGDPDTEELQVAIVDTPKATDEVVEAGGAQVFLEPQVVDTLDDKVLDAVQDSRGVHFAVIPQHPPGSAPGEAGSAV